MAVGQGFAAQSEKIECGSFVGKIQSIDGPASMPHDDAGILTVSRLPQEFSFTVSTDSEDGIFDVLKEAYRCMEYGTITMMLRSGKQWFMPRIELTGGEIQSMELGNDLPFVLNLKGYRKKVSFDHWFASPVFWAWTVWRKIQKWISR